MIYLDVDALNARFWASALTYKNEDGDTISVSDNQILVENGPEVDLNDELPWVRWTINPGSSVRDTMGINPTFKSIGTATLEIAVPKGMGSSVATDIADSLLGNFRDWRSEDKTLRIYKTNQAKMGRKEFLQVNATIFYESKRQP